jgi:hypothetical protein
MQKEREKISTEKEDDNLLLLLLKLLSGRQTKEIEREVDDHNIPLFFSHPHFLFSSRIP